MNTQENTDTQREALEQEREVLTRRLVPVLDAIDQKRHAVTDVVTGLSSVSGAPGGNGALVLAGALAGGVTFVLLSWVDRARARRNQPLRVMARALTRYVKPRRASPIKHMLTEAGASLVMTAASEVARVALLRWVGTMVETFRTDSSPEAPSVAISNAGD